MLELALLILAIVALVRWNEIAKWQLKAREQRLMHRCPSTASRGPYPSQRRVNANLKMLRARGRYWLNMNCSIRLMN